jgi:hypothetical protein
LGVIPNSKRRELIAKRTIKLSIIEIKESENSKIN